MPSSSDQMRLQKVIAQSGLASRRKAEILIQKGQVTVNGKVVTVLGTCVNPTRDHVKVSGRHLKPQPPDIFLMLHKPAGCVSTMADPLKRPTVADLLGKSSVRVFPVGRLDYDTEGLLLLTNNGTVSQACLHPRYSVAKTYLAKIKGFLTDQEIIQLRQGLILKDGQTAPAKVRKVQKVESNSWIELTIHEGRKHQVKRMLETIKHPVIKLKRIRFGPLILGDLPLGRYRYLTDREANALRALLSKRPTLPSIDLSSGPSKNFVGTNMDRTNRRAHMLATKRPHKRRHHVAYQTIPQPSTTRTSHKIRKATRIPKSREVDR